MRRLAEPLFSAVIVALLYLVGLFNLSWLLLAPTPAWSPETLRVFGVLILAADALSLLLATSSFFFVGHRWKLLLSAVVLGVLATIGVVGLMLVAN